MTGNGNNETKGNDYQMNSIAWKIKSFFFVENFSQEDSLLFLLRSFHLHLRTWARDNKIPFALRSYKAFLQEIEPKETCL